MHIKTQCTLYTLYLFMNITPFFQSLPTLFLNLYTRIQIRICIHLIQIFLTFYIIFYILILYYRLNFSIFDVIILTESKRIAICFKHHYIIYVLHVSTYIYGAPKIERSAHYETVT